MNVNANVEIDVEDGKGLLAVVWYDNTCLAWLLVLGLFAFRFVSLFFLLSDCADRLQLFWNEPTFIILLWTWTWIWNASFCSLWVLMLIDKDIVFFTVSGSLFLRVSIITRTRRSQYFKKPARTTTIILVCTVYFKLGVLFNVGLSYRLVRGLGMKRADRMCSLLQRWRQAGAEEKDIVEPTSRWYDGSWLGWRGQELLVNYFVSWEMISQLKGSV